MKKLLVTVMSLVLALNLCACSSRGSRDNKVSNSKNDDIAEASELIEYGLYEEALYVLSSLEETEETLSLIATAKQGMWCKLIDENKFHDAEYYVYDNDPDFSGLEEYYDERARSFLRNSNNLVAKNGSEYTAIHHIYMILGAPDSEYDYINEGYEIAEKFSDFAFYNIEYSDAYKILSNYNEAFSKAVNTNVSALSNGTDDDIRKSADALKDISSSIKNETYYREDDRVTNQFISIIEGLSDNAVRMIGASGTEFNSLVDSNNEYLSSYDSILEFINSSFAKPYNEMVNLTKTF